MLEQPVGVSSDVAIRGKVQWILWVSGNVDTFTNGGTEKYVVNENVPFYGQSLTVGWQHNNSNDVFSVCNVSFPLADWETL
jgi:hypothetical protein